MAEKLSAGQKLLAKAGSKIAKEKLVDLSRDEMVIEKFGSLFGDTEAIKLSNIAQQLTNAKLGKRKNETDLEYLMRINYCIFTGIDLSLVNATYIVDGKVARYVELKGVLFDRSHPLKDYPKKRIETLLSTKEMCRVRGTVDGKHWIEVDYDIEKAKALVSGASNPKNKHWVHNTQKMLNKSAKGDLYDLLNDTPMFENLIEGEKL